MKDQLIVVVGAGISGATIAERYASLGKKVIVIEKRDHIGGNCYDFYNEHGILVSKYGAHLFHTSYEDVWNYINQFASWYFYEHRVLACVDGLLVPVPVNITTVNKLFGESISNSQQMITWLEENRKNIKNPVNSEESCLARVGSVLYEKIFKNYTKKQWDKYPAELDASVLDRIPVRHDFDDRYFTDKYQFLPRGGYTRLFENMLTHPNITVALNTDYFEVIKDLPSVKKVFYTGPIDRFFNYKYSIENKLEYRSIRFAFETFDQEYFQENSVINYPNDHEYTRIVEYKHFTNQKHRKTTISKEYTVDHGEPYYPVPNLKNRLIYERYRQETAKLEGVYFVGRLGNYKYFNMDEAIKNALDLFYQLEGGKEQAFKIARYAA